MDILNKYKKLYKSKAEVEFTLGQYLALCKKDKTAYSSPADRMLKAIGEPTLVDSSKDPRLSRIFGNRVYKKYEVFSEFYGMEETIERIVSFFVHSAQGLEESKQILYLLGPVGSAKSSLAEKLKSLIEKEPIYVLKYGDSLSPIHESPLNLFKEEDSEELGIPSRHLRYKMSPWAKKRLKECEGDLSKFTVVKLYPSQLHQIAVAKTEPGDENNQDISSLVGKINIRLLEHHNQNDPDAYNFSGGLGLGNRGLLEFVEMFKAPIKMLHPLLTATQEQNYIGTEQIGAIPFEGIILAHSNETEWENFKNDNKNEAFIDRIFIVKVPYNLRVADEMKIYQKLINDSELRDKPCAPHTLEMLSQFTVSSRLVPPEDPHDSVWIKMKVYDGESVREKYPNAKSFQEYKDFAGVMEGMRGISTRFAFKVLSQVFNYDTAEIASNPVHLMYVLEKSLQQEQLPQEQEESYIAFIKNFLADSYSKKLEKDIQTCYLDSYSEYGQSVFDRYILFADHWIEDRDYRDPNTGNLYERDHLNKELSTIEKAAGISNPKDFRHEVVNYALRYRASNKGHNPKWNSYAKLRRVIETHMFDKTEDLLPVISFDGAGSAEEQKKHKSFLKRMMDMGYTEKQVRLLYEWFLRYKSNK